MAPEIRKSLELPENHCFHKWCGDILSMYCKLFYAAPVPGSTSRQTLANIWECSKFLLRFGRLIAILVIESMKWFSSL